MRPLQTTYILIALFVVLIFPEAARTQSVPFYAVAYGSQNYSQCSETSNFTNIYASAKTEVLLGNTVIYSNLSLLCPDLVRGCPVRADSIVDIEHSFTLPNTSIPIGDLIVLYMTQTGEQNGWACLALGPVGYQHPVWKLVFVYVPIGFTVFAALVSFFASFATVSDTQHDVFLFTSNYAMLPAALRLKTPGFFDLIYYAQFIVLTGQLNLAYPEFYSLFAANFSWSFLLFPTSWIPDATRTMFDMGVANGTRRFDETISLPVENTGINNFAVATGIDINSLFMTAFIFLLIILLAATALCGLIWVVVQIMAWYAPYRYAAQDSKVWNFTLGKCLSHDRERPTTAVSGH
ncbi:hypothetical protein BX666DRAFT_1519212 [Dichotomocladium elegans]|nr:hypothetical protein BX666DRAFT_1519212 [Dichotomocladium elegans]